MPILNFDADFVVIKILYENLETRKSALQLKVEMPIFNNSKIKVFIRKLISNIMKYPSTLNNQIKIRKTKKILKKSGCKTSNQNESGNLSTKSYWRDNDFLK